MNYSLLLIYSKINKLLLNWTNEPCIVINWMNICFQLYHATFILSAHSLNYSGPIFTLEELQEEFQDRILFGFLEGIWTLDIIYQGQRPVPTIPVENTGLDREDNDEETNNNDTKPNSLDQENYKRDFFAMLEDVIELSSDYPSVLVDPEFSIVHHS